MGQTGSVYERCCRLLRGQNNFVGYKRFVEDVLCEKLRRRANGEPPLSDEEVEQYALECEVLSNKLPSALIADNKKSSSERI